jgi:hypothetical protein
VGVLILALAEATAENIGPILQDGKLVEWPSLSGDDAARFKLSNN